MTKPVIGVAILIEIREDALRGKGGAAAWERYRDRDQARLEKVRLRRSESNGEDENEQ